jgi:hypothetical protein
MVNYKQHAISIGNPKIKNLMTMPKQTFQLVSAKGRMPPVLTEQGEFGMGSALDFGRERREFTFESDATPICHRSFTASRIVLKSLGSMASSGRSLASA